MARAKRKKDVAKKKDDYYAKILIGVPILAWTHEFAMSFLEFWTSLMTYKHKGKRFHIAYKFMYRKPVHMAEEQLAEFAINCGCTHILLMDDDIYNVHADDLMKLLDADKDVIGGIMHASGFPFAMCAFRRYDRKTKVADQPILKGPARLYELPPEQRKGIQKVDLIPFAFTLIKTEVLKKMKKPWFKCNTQAPTDSWFADRLLSKKLEYYAHFDVWLNHRGITRSNKPLQFQLGMHEQREKDNAGIIMLTPAEMRTHEAMMSTKLSEAEDKLRKSAADKHQFFEKSNKRAIAKPVGKR